MDSQVTPNTFCTYTGPTVEIDTTIFFISGNPGLIGYYHPFLSLLAQNLADAEANIPREKSQEGKLSPNYQIYGCNLGGFKIGVSADHDPQRELHGGGKMYNLEEQICFVKQKLAELMRVNATAEENGASRSSRRKVILIGHSVGAYIAMELLRRHREDTAETPRRSTLNSPRSNMSSTDFDIVGGVMLFPTIMHIAHSPSGQKLTKLLTVIPQLALVVGFLTRLLTLFLPGSMLRSLIRFVMGDPPTHALDTTYEFLESRGGVQQALHMAADEMRTITSDRWTDDVWGVGTAREPLMELFFYFGRNDHWVAEQTRDDIIALRGCKDGLGPQMFVCEEGLPHAFCLKHNDIMAQKVATMIRNIRMG